MTIIRFTLASVFLDAMDPMNPSSAHEFLAKVPFYEKIIDTLVMMTRGGHKEVLGALSNAPSEEEGFTEVIFNQTVLIRIDRYGDDHRVTITTQHDTETVASFFRRCGIEASIPEVMPKDIPPCTVFVSQNDAD
ncbi:MAG: hypothetical protein PHT88_01765 [Candidatus Moranbacteria bacterium]|nr:hypothetical protein [Candidatus Moranbacteria bacterium]